MNFIDLYKKDNTYFSNWTTDYDSTVYIAGNIEPFTYNASETDDEYMSLFILSDANLNLLKSKL
jgi:spore coat protein CotH